MTWAFEFDKKLNKTEFLVYHVGISNLVVGWWQSTGLYNLDFEYDHKSCTLHT